MTFLHKKWSTAALMILSFATSWSFMHLNAAVGAPRLAEGSVDARGFRAKLVDEDSGQPVRFNPCEPIHYVINPSVAPPSGVEDMRTAVEMTAEASGLQFVYDGITDEVPAADRPAYQPDRYGDRWAPVLLAWTDGLDMADAAPDTEGRRPVALAASHHEVNDDGAAVYVTGVAVFDASATYIPGGFGGQTWGQGILHELGHVLGLDHVDDPTSVMNPVMGLRAALWGGGDRAGLWALGIGSPCVATPETP